jgi:hypothetical protein
MSGLPLESFAWMTNLTTGICIRPEDGTSGSINVTGHLEIGT